ncbi:hypothetical protein LJC59_00085 [Desulfovibrio sp. OttesenSCG-928-A18]|nr:hypothetical protein [Desulfovibrio sp. OttesenSCG-928-A18]
MNQANTLAVREVQPMAFNITDYAMQADSVLAQVSLLQDILSKVMKKGEHYDVIPNCGTKQVLLKPGAEKILMTFRLTPTYQIDERQMPNNHREYLVVATLTSIITNQLVGQGAGSCSTMESKYRYRTGGGEVTDVDVPKAYWDAREDDPIAASKILKEAANADGHEGDKFGVKKNEGGFWKISTHGSKIENDNPADCYNTCLKMAQKRALVAAVLTATAASDIFTQDLEDEDTASGIKGRSGQGKSTQAPPAQKQRQGGNGSGDHITPAQITLLRRAMDENNWTDEMFTEALKENMGISGGMEALSRQQATAATDAVRKKEWLPENYLPSFPEDQ